MTTKDKLMSYFGKRLRESFLKVDESVLEKALEIRLRVQRPIILRLNERELYFSENGLSENKENALIAEKKDLKQILELMSDYSIYSLEEELKSGFLTLKGGFRVGVTGRCICENKEIKAVRYINGINIRICREIKGCADKLVKLIIKEKLKNILILSPPNCGKTTLLRDMIRNLSNSGFNIGLIDERSEISGCYMGDIQNDVGMRTDILDRCPKTEGIFMLLRSMASDYIALDEITYKEIEPLREAIGCGVGIICTAHANGIEDILSKKSFEEIRKKQLFELYVVLGKENKIGEITGAYDKNLEEIKEVTGYAD